MSELERTLKNLPDSILEKFARDCNSWGDQCAGGAGREVMKSGPLAGHQYGEPYYEAALQFRLLLSTHNPEKEE